MKIAFITLMLLIGPLLLRAQDQGQGGQQMPQGPLLNRASVPSQWTITAQLAPPAQGDGGNGSVTGGGTADGSKPKPAKPRITNVSKDGSFIFEKTLTENGEVMQTWYAGKLTATQVNGGEWSVMAGTGNSFNTTDYSKSDFAGFDWVALNNFTGRQNINGKKCLVFKDKVITMDPQEIEMMKAAMGPAFNIDRCKVDVEADIDDKSRLPVMLTYKTGKGTMTRTYVFQPSAQTISIPSDVQKTLDKYKAVQKRMSVPNAPI